jgi:predicted DNA-binding protein
MEEWCADNSKVRTLRTYLTDIQIKNLEKVSKKTGLTVSEHIRRIIGEYLEKFKDKEKG